MRRLSNKYLTIMTLLVVVINLIAFLNALLFESNTSLLDQYRVIEFLPHFFGVFMILLVIKDRKLLTELPTLLLMLICLVLFIDYYVGTLIFLFALFTNIKDTKS